MSNLYVYRPDGQHAGPYTTEMLAKAIVDGAVERDAYVAPPGGAQWQHASQMPEVVAQIEAVIRARSPSVVPPRSAPPLPLRASQAQPSVQIPTPPKAPSLVQASDPFATPPSVPSAAARPSIATAAAEAVPSPIAPVAAPVAFSVQIGPPVPIEPSVPIVPSPSEVKPTARPAPAASDKPKAKPWPQHLSVAIFGGFFLVALIELTVGLVRPGPDVAPEEEGMSAAAKPAK